MLMSLTALGLLAALGTAQALEIRFYPAGKLRQYELDATRGVRSVVLQNVAIINDGSADAAILQVDLELLEHGVAIDTRRLRAEQLDRVAAAGARLQSSGMLALVSFQFGGPALLPKDTSLAATRTLKPGTALLLTQQVFAFTGQRDAVRVNVQTTAGMSEATLFISPANSQTAFALPFEGTWYDGAGPSLHTHHRWAVPEEFAHDFIRIGADGLAYAGSGTSFADYYAYGQPVLAAADGQVVAVLDDEPEDTALLQRADEPLEAYVQRIVERQNKQLVRGARGIVGNHVVIRHGTEYSFYAHLKPGSVRVKVDDNVSRGQQIAAVGSSGSSTEPHLHFQVCDAPDVLACAGIPVRFDNVEIYGVLQARQVQSGDLVRNRKVDAVPK
jgi:murein DD-endopeptidase MepM/ murein hydrolase activator NlpD